MLRWLFLIDREMAAGRSRLKVVNYTRQIRLEINKDIRRKNDERKQSDTGR